MWINPKKVRNDKILQTVNFKSIHLPRFEMIDESSQNFWIGPVKKKIVLNPKSKQKNPADFRIFEPYGTI